MNHEWNYCSCMHTTCSANYKLVTAKGLKVFLQIHNFFSDTNDSSLLLLFIVGIMQITRQLLNEKEIGNHFCLAIVRTKRVSSNRRLLFAYETKDENVCSFRIHWKPFRAIWAAKRRQIKRENFKWKVQNDERESRCWWSFRIAESLVHDPFDDSKPSSVVISLPLSREEQ